MNRDLRSEVAEGSLYIHSRLNANTTKTLEATAFLYALIELLEEKGLRPSRSWTRARRWWPSVWPSSYRQRRQRRHVPGSGIRQVRLRERGQNRL